jgi:sugar phosphate isomerase/epimerase
MAVTKSNTGIDKELLYVSTTFIEDRKSLRDALILCSDSMIHNIEIGSNHIFENYEFVHDYCFNFLVHNYFPVPEEPLVVNLASIDDRIRRRSVVHISGAIDFCAEIGAELYTFHPGFITDPSGSNRGGDNFDFQWDRNQLSRSNYVSAWNNMVAAISEVVEYARSRKVRIAFETQGSFHKSDHLLMQQPEEYERLLALFAPEDLGVNLNIGHLILAANAFGFSRESFVNQVADRVVAMELSHNDGAEDQHLPLQESGWYWDLILDERFVSTYKILEFRNTNIKKIGENLEMIKRKQRAV